MKKKIVACTLAIVMVFTGIAQAYAAVTTIAIGLAGALGDLAIQWYLGTQQEKAQAETQLNNYWYSSGGGGRGSEVMLSWEALNQLCAELNMNGFPCKVVQRFNGGTGTGWEKEYVIRGYGWVTVPGYIPTTAVHYSINGLNLHAIGQEHVPFVAVKPDDTYSLLNSVYSQVVNIANLSSAISSKITDTITAINSLVQYIDGIEGYIDGIETSLSNIATRTLNTANRLTTTINGTAYSAATLLGNIWGLTSDIKTLITDNLYVSAYTYDANSTDYPHFTISIEQADELVAYLNANYIGKTMTLVLQDNSISNTSRIFEGANITNGVIRIRSTSNGSSVNYFFITPQHYWFSVDNTDKSEKDLYGKLNDIDTTLNNLTGSGNTTNIKTTIIGFGAAIDAQFTGIAQGIANLDANLSAFASLNGTIGSLFSVFGGLFDDLIDSVNGSIADLSNLESYTDGIEGLLTNNQTALIKAVDTDGIWLNNNTSTVNNMPSVYISSDMADAMIATINSGRAGDYGNFYSSNYTASYQPMISYAYRDPDNNRIRVYAKNSSGNNSNMTLVTPDGKKYEIVDNPVSNVVDYLHVQIDNVDYTVAQLEALTASNTKEILEWLQGADLSNITIITDLIEDYGSNISTSVLRSSKLLQLYNEAFLSHFRDINDLNWNQIFAYFYEFNTNSNIAEVT